MRIDFKFLISWLVAIFLGGHLFAQTPPVSTFVVSGDSIKNVKDAMQKDANDAAQIVLNDQAASRPITIQIGQVIQAYYASVAKLSAHQTLVVASVAMETARTDKQIGASSSSSAGTTSVSDRPGIAEILGFALEHGAITQQVQQNTLTLSSSPYAIAAWFGGGDTAENYKRFADSYGRLGFSANFNLTDTNDPLANARRKQLNEWSAKLRLGADHSGRSKAAAEKFEADVGPALQKLAIARSGILAAAFGTDHRFTVIKQHVFHEVNSYLAAPAHQNISDAEKRSGLAEIIRDTIFDELQQDPLDDATMRQVASFIHDFDSAAAQDVTGRKELDDAIADLAKLPAYSLVYLQEQPSVGKNYSVLKFVYEQSAANMPQITANISGSLYHHPDPALNQDTFRDFTASVEFLQKIGRSPFLQNPANKASMNLSFSGRYERMPENKGVKGKKADIAVAGVKFEIPLGVGISIPISVTYANASELIKEAHVNGNFGITFDLDKLKVLGSK